MSLVLITPTGARQMQINLCARWMRQQTYKGEVIWIIVDDAYPITTKSIKEDFKANWIIVKAFPKPSWAQGQNTQRRNMDYGIELMELNFDKKDIEAIFIIEDDDYYKPVYLERMMKHKGNFWAFGETRTVYYNVVNRLFFVNPNLHHSSLFQTAFTVEAIPYMKKSHTAKFIDAQFWKVVPNKNLFSDNKLSIGIKGMAGRAGIGAGHNWNNIMSPDVNMKYLNQVIGTDAKLYERFYRETYRGKYRGRPDILTNRRRRR